MGLFSIQSKLYVHVVVIVWPLLLSGQLHTQATFIPSAFVHVHVYCMSKRMFLLIHFSNSVCTCIC